MGAKKDITVELYANTLVPGMILRGDCYDDSGKRWINSSKPITAEEIALLTQAKVHKLFYSTNHISTKNETSSMILSDQTIGKAMSVLEDIQRQISANQFNLPIRELHDVVMRFLTEITDTKSGFLNLIEASGFDEYTYSHSINVSTMSVMMGIALKMDESRINNIGIAGLILDIGKTMIPQVLAITDTFDATTSLRPYRNPGTFSDAAAFVMNNT